MNKSYYKCPKKDFVQCQRNLEECKCKGCHDCLLASCLKKKLGCKISASEGKPQKLCSVVATNESC